MDYFIGNLYLDNKQQFQQQELSKFISDWNKKVKKTDVVYIISGLLNNITNENVNLVKKLNGKKILIYSGKDKISLEDDTYRILFDEVYAYKEIKYKTYRICLSYTPFLFNNFKEKQIVLYSYSLKNPQMGIKDTIFYSTLNQDKDVKFIDVNWRRLSNSLPLSIDELINYKEIRSSRVRKIKSIQNKTNKTSKKIENQNIETEEEHVIKQSEEKTSKTSAKQKIKVTVTDDKRTTLKDKKNPQKEITSVSKAKRTTNKITPISNTKKETKTANRSTTKNINKSTSSKITTKTKSESPHEPTVKRVAKKTTNKTPATSKANNNKKSSAKEKQPALVSSGTTKRRGRPPKSAKTEIQKPETVQKKKRGRPPKER